MQSIIKMQKGRIATIIGILIFMPLLVVAKDTPATLTSGVIQVKFQAVSGPDSLPTVSISLNRVDTNKRVFCESLDEFDIASGPTEPIDYDAPQVLLAGFAWSGANCTGVVSLPSDDRYLVTFAAPMRPILVLVP